MSHRICPWWIGYLLVSPLRRWFHHPVKIVAPYVREGMTVLEPGPGMGFFTIPIARLLGSSGRVVAVDVQPKMIASLKRRAATAHVLDRIDARVASVDQLGIDDLTGKVDFTLAFAVVHELPDAARFFAEAVNASKPQAQILLAEPRGHVSLANFEAEISSAQKAGFAISSRPEIRRSHAALLTRK